MQEYDKSSKWLIEHHGDSILSLAGVRKSPTGNRCPPIWSSPGVSPTVSSRFEAPAQAAPDVFILEIATYPDARVPSQAVRDTALVFLARDIVPEVVVLFLHPKGNVEAAGSVELRSRLGLTKWNLSWKAVKLWEVPAEELFAAGDIGLIPWVPLSQFDGPPEPILRKCRARIDQVDSPNDQENLLAVTQFLARLRYNDEMLFQILGGREAMIESPVLQELREEWTRETMIKDLMAFLVGRFGTRLRPWRPRSRPSGRRHAWRNWSRMPLPVAPSQLSVSGSLRDSENEKP